MTLSNLRTAKSLVEKATGGEKQQKMTLSLFNAQHPDLSKGAALQLTQNGGDREN